MNCRKILIYSLSIFQDRRGHKLFCVCLCMNHSYTYAATRKIKRNETCGILFSAPSIKLILNCSTFIYYQSISHFFSLSWVFAVIQMLQTILQVSWIESLEWSASVRIALWARSNLFVLIKFLLVSLPKWITGIQSIAVENTQLMQIFSRCMAM